jgi:molybdopterin converting factor subunit 1
MNEAPNHIQVLFFAHLRELTGTRELEMEISSQATVGDLKAILVEKFPPLQAAMDHLIAAVNQNFAQDKVTIPINAEVAFFPPVSGGSQGVTICRITETGLDINQTLTEITSPSTGGICTFTGVVREFSPDGTIKQTEKLEYEAYKPMAESKMKDIAEEIRTRWPKVEGIALVQRVGLVDPGTPVVLIACSGAHRDEGIFEAARFGIDRLKEIVPVWKKEIGPEGEEWIEGSFNPEEKSGK